ncbi:MAG: caspase family protein [Chitinophagaceae bacterium]|nr:caspase family protein [Chitinophagaceae bacterium]
MRMVRSSILKRVFALSASFFLSILLYSQENSFLSFQLQKNGNLLQGNAVVYEGEKIQGLISVDRKKWDGHSNYYCYILHYTDTDTLVDLFYPFDKNSDENKLPGTVSGLKNDKVQIFEGVVTPPFGKDVFVLLMTENKINLGDFQRGSKTINKEELMKLVKGSKLSAIYEPGFGRYSLQTLQFESRPSGEKQGIAKSINTARNFFVVGDSAEFFYTPVPQPDIVRDSFPLVDIVYPSTDQRGAVTVSGSTQKIVIRGVASDFRHGIKDVSINGQKVEGHRESGYFECLYEPVEGSNVADVSVENKAGYRRTVRVKFNYRSELKSVTASGKDHLFIVGINKYQSWPQLNNARKDGSDFKQLMVETFGFQPANVKELYDTRASRDSIFNQLMSYVKTLNENDRLLIYFAGHGFYDPDLELGYWVPYEARINSSQDYINNLDVTRMIRKMKAKSIFLIVDACYSGQLLRDMRSDQKGDYRSRLVLCSGKLQPVPDGKPGENSPFAKQVLYYLQKEKGHDILATALIESLKQSFHGTAEQKPVGGPIDEVSDENGDFILKPVKRQ